MIFVTVGTHEQQFNRLIKYIDKMVQNKKIKEEVIIQSGFSTCEIRNCKNKKLIPYSEMIENIKKARIIISHGGPATFIMPLQFGKIPIVVPRLKEYEEHINNHQLEFAEIVSKRQGNIILIKDIENLESAILNYDKLISTMPKELKSNNKVFNNKLKKIIEEIV